MITPPRIFFPLGFVLFCSVQLSVINADDELSKLTPTLELVENYCLDCHNSDDPAGGFELDSFSSSLPNLQQPWDTSKWEKIVKRLRSRQMPPAAEVRPSEEEYLNSLNAMESILRNTAQKFPQPGKTESIRRLNRTEYQNAIRDLLKVDIDVTTLLPSDQSGHGFDNVTVGELPPVLLSRYIIAAEKIARIAVGRKLKNPQGTTIRLPADFTQEKHVAGLPLGTRGGTLIKHQFPVSGEYEVQIRLTRDRDENIEGLNEPHDIDILLDRDLIHRFNVSKPKNKNGGWSSDDTLVDANLKKRFQVTAGSHQLGVTFPQKFASLNEIKRQPFDTAFNRHRHPRQTPALFEVSIVGPFEQKLTDHSESRQLLFSNASTNLSAEEQAKEILSPLIRIAYRRPITDEDLLVPLNFFNQQNSANGFEAGIEAAITAILVNPHFLFKAEVTPATAQHDEAYQISDLELATRLSFFLWSSLPDDQLLSHAESNQLHKPEILNEEVLRMLNDPRSESLTTNFAAQWLYLRNLDSFKPDKRIFPDFDDNLRKAMRKETELLFESVHRQNKSVLNLIKSNETFVNERLAKHYGIPHIYGGHFRPVQVDNAETHRGGLLRHASILAITSYSTRTAPTLRGNWILGNILGTPPPPPPPNVPDLKEKKTSALVSIRERLAVHRENPACASCHDLIDPIGFAFENYDAVGRYRHFDQGLSIDSSGALPDGTKVNSISDLEQGIVNRPEMFVGTMAEKLLTFALGRGIETYDGPAIRKIVEDSADDNYRFSSLIQNIVSSQPFKMRTAN